MTNSSAYQNGPAATIPEINIETTSINENDNAPISSPTSPATPVWDGSWTNDRLGRERSLTATSLAGSTVAPSTASTPRPSTAGLDVPKSRHWRYGSTTSLISKDEVEKAFVPDARTEAEFKVDKGPFAFTPGHLNRLFNPKSLPVFVALGGLPGLEKGLRTSITSGLSVDESRLDGTISIEEAQNAAQKTERFEDITKPVLATDAATGPAQTSSEAFDDRIRVYKRNVLPAKKATPLWRLAWNAYQDKILILLSVAAAISLALGLYETLGVEHPAGSPPSIDWVEGLAICIAIIIVVLVGSLNDWQKERAFVKLNAKKEDREVKAIRSGKSYMISVHDVLVGDVLHLEPGDLVPADGIFITGHNVKCDESSATGESDQLKKTGGVQVMNLINNNHTDIHDMDPFILSGSKVLEGVGTYLVTSVGENSSYGKILMSMRTDMEPTPLQVKLDGLATAIAKLGTSAAGLLFFVLFFRFLADLNGHLAPLPPAEKGSKFLDILIVAITVIVVAVPEGLPLAVTLALAFATTRLVKQNNLVRILKSCETMGNATTVCSDKTGTLTQNKMTVVTGTFKDLEFDDKNRAGKEISSSAFSQQLTAEEKRTLVEAIAVNSTAFEGEEDGQVTFVGSKTETALLAFARIALGMGSVSEERVNNTPVQLLPFDSKRKCMGAVYKLANGGYRFLVKGASEIVLGQCTSIWNSTGTPQLDGQQRERIEGVINSYAEQSLRTIALAHRDFSQWPPAGAQSSEDPTSADLDILLGDMTFDGVVGIQDPVRPGVPEAVAKCQSAGVVVRMVTGDNVVTAKAIAKECGIYTDGEVMEGPVFRTLSDEEMKAKLPHLQVLARSSPEDKRILVTKLREMGDIVAVTGDGTNDGPALKAADIGFSMGIAGTEVAKEASAIILMDDNFASILTALMWGRAVNDAVRKFLQFQITVNITAVIITFVSAVQDPEMDSVLTAVQLLWINLIMDSMAALALATDPPTEEILARKPTPRTAPLISPTMWKMILGQALFQLLVTFLLYFLTPHITSWTKVQTASVVFNTFVWMQIFNIFNNRRLDNGFNVVKGVWRNRWFLGVVAVMVGAQAAIAQVGGSAFSIKPINGTQWGICIGLSVLCLPWAVLVRLFPDEWFVETVRVVTWPLVWAYGPSVRVWDRAWGRVARGLRKLRRSKRSEDGGAGSAPEEAVAADEEKGASRA